MNKGDSTNDNDNKAHVRKGKSLVEFNAKKYFSNLAENSKFTFYCQILARQEEIPQKTSKNISRYFCSSFQGHM